MKRLQLISIVCLLAIWTAHLGYKLGVWAGRYYSSMDWLSR